jgi:hypothetical protein
MTIATYRWMKNHMFCMLKKSGHVQGAVWSTVNQEELNGNSDTRASSLSNVAGDEDLPNRSK